MNVGCCNGLVGEILRKRGSPIVTGLSLVVRKYVLDFTDDVLLPVGASSEVPAHPNRNLFHENYFYVEGGDTEDAMAQL